MDADTKAVAHAGDEIERLRIEAGLTQAELATRARVSHSLIQKAEGKGKISRPKLRQIAEALGKRLEDFLPPAPHPLDAEAARWNLSLLDYSALVARARRLNPKMFDQLMVTAANHLALETGRPVNLPGGGISDGMVAATREPLDAGGRAVESRAEAGPGNTRSPTSTPRRRKGKRRRRVERKPA